MACSFRGAPPHRNRIPSEVRDMRFVKFGLLLLALAAAASAAAQEPVDWPREFAAAGGTAVVYQPQPETLEGDVLTARSAVSVTRSTDTEPRFGAVWFEALLDIDREKRIAYFDSVHVSRVEFGDLADRVAPGIEAPRILV